MKAFKSYFTPVSKNDQNSQLPEEHSMAERKGAGVKAKPFAASSSKASQPPFLHEPARASSPAPQLPSPSGLQPPSPVPPSSNSGSRPQPHGRNRSGTNSYAGSVSGNKSSSS